MTGPNRLRRCAGMAVLIAAVATAAAQPVPDWVPEARAAAASLAGTLVPTLQAAIREGGTSNAVSVCRIEAPVIAARVSNDRVEIGRTALRVRNPDNAPDDWERSMLESFASRMAAGADPASLESWTTEWRDGRHVGRWIKAIPTAPMCTTCHGVDLEPDLAAAIAALYPADQATGFRVGELRGAFTATIDLSRRDPPSPPRD